MERGRNNTRGEIAVIIYIAGPITGVPDYHEKFQKARTELNRHDWIVFDPSVLPSGLPWEAYMPICYSMMDASDAIYFLRGWERSRGARLEFERATKRGIKIMFEEGCKP